MRNVIIRELKPVDMDKMLDLLLSRDELDEERARKRKQLMEWCAFRNPFSNNEPTYLIAEDKGEIVAHLGRMPTEFIINGSIKRGYFIHDLYVHPKYRKKGFGYFLSMSLYMAVEEKSKFFCCLVWTTALNLELQRRRGYQELLADRFIKLLNPHAELKEFLWYQKLKQFLLPRRYITKSNPKSNLGDVFDQESSDTNVRFLNRMAKVINLLLGRIILLAEPILGRLIRCKARIVHVVRFDSRFDQLNQEIIPKLGISSLKTSGCLNWKYVDRPFNTTSILAAEEDDRILGYVILELRSQRAYPEGTIITIMVDPEDTKTILSLCRATIDFFKEKEVHCIECCLTDRRFIKVLNKFLFFKAFRREPLMLANLRNSEDREYLTDINNWHLTYGDSDNFMLEP